MNIDGLEERTAKADDYALGAELDADLEELLADDARQALEIAPPVTMEFLTAQIDSLGRTALRIKAERDQMRDALNDLAFGAELMLQLGLSYSPSVRKYIEEVRRVAIEAVVP